MKSTTNSLLLQASLNPGSLQPIFYKACYPGEMNTLINVTPLARALLALVSLQLPYLALGAATPSNHELVKRADINCVPKSPDTELIFGDCVDAILSVLANKTSAQMIVYQYFGFTMSADEQFHLLEWHFGTLDWHIKSVSASKVAYSK